MRPVTLANPNADVWEHNRCPSESETLETELHIQVAAFFLPQFRRLEQNNQAWGEGFTEWSNVLQGIPRFESHRQPRLPSDNLLFSLSQTGELDRQARLASEYGINVFAYYYYSFGPQTVLAETIQEHADSLSIPVNFMLVWANESWTRRWDGHTGEVICKQHYSPEYTQQLAMDSARFFLSPHYHRTSSGRPIFVVYNPSELPDQEDFLREFKRVTRTLIGKEPYLVAAETFGASESTLCLEWDATVEFPPHQLTQGDWLYEPIGFSRRLQASFSDVSPSFRGHIADYEVFSQLMCRRRPPSRLPRLRTAMLEWDNSPRNPIHGSVYANFSLSAFGHWLQRIMTDALENPVAELQPLVFINAWNEWAEGSYLQPDRDYGLGYLETVKRARESATRIVDTRMRSFGSHSPPRSKAALLYVQSGFSVRGLSEFLVDAGALSESFDVFVTTDCHEAYDHIKELGLDVSMSLAESRGGQMKALVDFLPFFLSKNYGSVLVSSFAAGRLSGMGSTSSQSYGPSNGDVASFVKASLDLIGTKRIGLVSLRPAVDELQAQLHRYPVAELIAELVNRIGLPEASLNGGEWLFCNESAFLVATDTILPLCSIPEEWFPLPSSDGAHRDFELAVAGLLPIAVRAAGKQHVTI